MSFDYTSNVREKKTARCTQDLFDTVVDSTKVVDVCGRIAVLHERHKRGELTDKEFTKLKNEEKAKLPAFLFHATFSDSLRHDKSAIPSGLSILDIDHIDDPEAVWRSIAPWKEELGIVLAYETPSKEGLRIVFVLPEGMGLAEGQKWLAGKIGVKEYDGVCKDYSRCSFAVPRDYIYYMDPVELFKDREVKVPTDNEGIRNFKTSIYHKSQFDPMQGQQAGGNSTSTLPQAPVAKAEERDLRAFDRVVELCGLTRAAINEEGQRHGSLVSLMSQGLPRLMPRARLEAVVKERMPEFYCEADCRGIIADWYDERKYYDPSAPMSKEIRQVFASLADGKQQDEEQRLPRWDIKLKNLPAALRATLDVVPEDMRVPVLCAVMPLAAAYADGVRVRYVDGQTHRLNLLSLIIGPQASGKSSCSRMIHEWVEPMRRADEDKRRAEDECKKKNRQRKANERGVEMPEAVVRYVPVTISCTTLLKRMKHSGGHTLYSFSEELDTLVKSNGAGSWSQKYDVYRMAFDNSYWGQDYSSEQSESGLVRVAYNLTLLGTYGSFHRCFGKGNVENGLSSRFIISEMPDRSFAPIPKFKELTDKQRKAITDGIERLSQASGTVLAPKTTKAIARWLEEKRIEAMADGDTVKDTYRKRAAVIGFRCGVVFMLLDGMEKKACADFATEMAEYVFEEQCRLFGSTLAKSADDGLAQTYNSRRKRLFDMLPDEFTFDDVRASADGSTTAASLRTTLSKWRTGKWIERVSKNVWRKLLKRSSQG